jgi:hypothetical protein
MDDRVQALVAEPVAVLLGLPHAVVAQPSLEPLDGEVDDQPGWRHVPKLGANALVERGVDRNVLGERVRISIRIIFGLKSSIVWLTLSSGQ